jgi:hypothetical protein
MADGESLGMGRTTEASKKLEQEVTEGTEIQDG